MSNMLFANCKLLHPDASLPKYAKRGDAGMDLTAVETTYDDVRKQLICSLGIAMQIPEGYVGLIYPRSSIYKKDLRLSNCTGVIDSGYRGEIKAIFDDISKEKDGNGNFYEAGDRVCQIILMPFPFTNFVAKDSLEDSERGTGGFGSSGQ